MKPLEILQSMDNAYKRKRYPSVPDNALPSTRYRQRDANSITSAILAFLRLKDHYCSRIQSQGQYNPTLKRWTKSTVRKGISDIHAVIAGKHCSIEVKANQDKMSNHQEQTRDEVQRSGGLYFVARDFDSFYQWYLTLNPNNHE